MRSLIGTALLVGGLTAVPVTMVANGTSVAAPGDVCASTTFSWNGDQLFVPWQATLDTGVVIPAAGPGETLTISSATYSTYDQYPDGQVPSRATAGQTHESVGITVGGTQVGGLSTDVPNGVAEGAPTDWYSGIVTGSFGGGGTVISGGTLVIRHASLYGFNESYNSVRVSQVSVTVERCAPAPTTTAAPTTAAPTTTETGSGGPTTTAAVTCPDGSAPTTVAGGSAPGCPAVTTTTAVGSGGPTTTAAVTCPDGSAPTTVAGGSAPGCPAVTTTTAVGSAGPTPGTLPTTGSSQELAVSLALLASLTGALLLMIGRRPLDA